uniref:Uncharacterized protein n=1 Tax=Zea mays TaxID=4577 RepID=A0A804LP79_MAIZE
MSSLASVLDSQVKTSDSDPVPITCASSQICLSAAGGDYYSPASHLLELEGVCFLLDCPSTSPPSWPSRRCPSPVMQGVSSMWDARTPLPHWAPWIRQHEGVIGANNIQPSIQQNLIGYELISNAEFTFSPWTPFPTKRLLPRILDPNPRRSAS